MDSTTQLNLLFSGLFSAPNLIRSPLSGPKPSPLAQLNLILWHKQITVEKVLPLGSDTDKPLSSPSYHDPLTFSTRYVIASA